MNDPVSAAPSPSLWLRWPGRAVRLMLAILPLVWLLHRLDGRQVLARASELGPRAIGLALAMLIGSAMMASFRWQRLLRAYGAATPPSVPTLFRHYMVSVWFSLLPSGMAGDVVRGYRVRECVGGAAAAYTVIFVERITGLLGLVLIAAAAYFSGSELHTGLVAWTLNAAIVGAVGLSLVMFAMPYVLARWPKLRSAVLRIPIAGPVAASIPRARSVADLAVAVLQSLVTQGAVVASVALLLAPAAPYVSFATCARVVPAIVLFTFIPLTPAGVGQREVAFVQLFGLAHVPADVALATSLVYFALSLVLAAVGGVVLLAERVLDLDS